MAVAVQRVRTLRAGVMLCVATTVPVQRVLEWRAIVTVKVGRAFVLQSVLLFWLLFGVSLCCALLWRSVRGALLE